ncbi:MAG: RluA family pseudouridine synthase [Candidatus Gracilibacteria bacterium]|nr:RluA family pseudouridine synthase [Candidatus Gracilibacteria bacterium]
MQLIQINHASDSDQRVDKFLKKYLPNASLGSIYKWLRTGKIKVNKKKVDQTYRLEIDDEIQLHFHEEEMKMMQLEEKNEKNISPITLEVLYEDEFLMVINKPAGINVHPGDHKTSEVSLIELIHDQLDGRYDSLSFRPSLVHRIDRDTSGAILIAKEKKTLEILLSLLQTGKIEKIYHAIVIGKPPKPRNTITAKLERRENAKDEAKVIVSPNGQEAITHYTTIKENIHEKYSLLECRIETGRTHQIRVHMAHEGMPILGDKAYGNLRENSFAKKNYGIERQLLHAYSLTFLHPILQKAMQITAPYPKDFRDIIS